MNPLEWKSLNAAGLRPGGLPCQCTSTDRLCGPCTLDLFLRFGRVKLPEGRPIAAMVSPNAFCFVEAYKEPDGRRAVQVCYGWNGWYRMQPVHTSHDYRRIRENADFIFFAIEQQAARDIRRALEMEEHR